MIDLSSFFFSSEIIFCFFFLSKILAYYSRWHKFKIMLFFFFAPYSFFFETPILLRFSKTRKLWSSKAAFKIGRFSLPSIIIRMTSNEPWNTNTQNGSKSTYHKSQTMTFWIRWSKLLFPKSPAKMIDGSEKRKRQLAFERQNSGVYEKRSESIKIFSILTQRWWLKFENDEYLKHFFYCTRFKRNNRAIYTRKNKTRLTWDAS